MIVQRVFSLSIAAAGIAAMACNSSLPFRDPGCDSTKPSNAEEPCHDEVKLCSTNTPDGNNGCDDGTEVNKFPTGCIDNIEVGGGLNGEDLYGQTNCSASLKPCYRPQKCEVHPDNPFTCIRDIFAVGGDWINKNKKYSECCGASS